MKSIFLSAQQRRELKAAFQCFDVDQCGYIDLKDTRMALLWLGFNVSKDELRNILGGSAPKLENGKVSLQVLNEVVEAKLNKDEIGSVLRKAFEWLKDDSGYITFDSLKRNSASVGTPWSDDDINLVIQETDLNNDGLIDEKELQNILFQ